MPTSASPTPRSTERLPDGQLAALGARCWKRFGRKLNRGHVGPELIGGIRVVVGDEVLDTSVKRPAWNR